MSDYKYSIEAKNVNKVFYKKSRQVKAVIDFNIKITHFGAEAVYTGSEFQLEKNRNWHWMWSTFYFNKKHNGYISALIKIFPKFFSSLFKFIFYFIFLKKYKSEIHKHRLLGIINSVLLKKSWYRPSLN